MRDLIKKIPKLKGHRRTGPKRRYIAIQSAFVAKRFKKGEVVTPKLLVQRGLVKRIEGKIPAVKLLNPGRYLEGFQIRDCRISGQGKKL